MRCSFLGRLNDRPPERHFLEDRVEFQRDDSESWTPSAMRCSFFSRLNDRPPERHFLEDRVELQWHHVARRLPRWTDPSLELIAVEDLGVSITGGLGLDPITEPNSPCTHKSHRNYRPCEPSASLQKRDRHHGLSKPEGFTDLDCSLGQHSDHSCTRTCLPVSPLTHQGVIHRSTNAVGSRCSIRHASLDTPRQQSALRRRTGYCHQSTALEGR
jgi:hypothetical protein